MKKFTTILSLLVVLGVAFAVSACTRTLPVSTTEKKAVTTEKQATTKQKTTVAPHTHEFATLKHDETNHWYECGCGEKNNSEAHTYGEWIVDTEATLEADGAKHRVCSVCEYTENAVIDQLNKLAAPVIELDVATGEVTWEDVENASSYAYKVAYGKDWANSSDWQAVPEEGLTLAWGQVAVVKAVAGEGFVDSNESNGVERFYTNTVAVGKTIGYLDTYKYNPGWTFTYDAETGINHVKVSKDVKDWSGVCALVSGKTEGLACKITVTNVTAEFTDAQLLFKWNDVEDSVNWSNYMNINRTGKNVYMFKKNWVAGQENLQALPFMLTWKSDTPVDFEFDLKMEWIDIKGTETYKFDKENSKVVYSKTFADADWNNANKVIKELAVTETTIVDLLAMPETTKDIYTVTGYVSEVKAADKYGNGYLMDDAGNIIIIYGCNPLDSGSYQWQFNSESGALELNKYSNKKSGTDLLKVGDKVTLLVQHQVYNGTQEIVAELVEVVEEGALQKKGNVNAIAIDGVVHTEATFDKAEYKFNDEVKLTFSNPDTGYAIKSVTVTRQSKNSFSIFTVTPNEAGEYIWNVGWKDSVKVVVANLFDVESEEFVATAENTGLVEGARYVKITYKATEASTAAQLEVPAVEYYMIEAGTIKAVNEAEYDLTINTSGNLNVKPYIFRGYITEITTDTKTGESFLTAVEGGVAYKVKLFAFFKFQYGVLETKNTEGTGYNKNLVVTGKSAVVYGTKTSEEDTNEYVMFNVGDYVEIVGYNYNYYNTIEINAEFVKVIEAAEAPKEAGVKYTIDTENLNVSAKKVVLPDTSEATKYDVLANGTSYSDGSAVTFTKNEDDSFSCATKNGKYFGWNKLTVPAGMNFFVFTIETDGCNISYKVDDSTNSLNAKQINKTFKGKETIVIDLSTLKADLDSSTLVKFCMWGYSSTNPTIKVTEAYFTTVDPTPMEKAAASFNIGDKVRIYASSKNATHELDKITVKHINGGEEELAKAEGKDYFEYVVKVGDELIATSKESGYENPVWEVVTKKEEEVDVYYLQYISKVSEGNTNPEANDIVLESYKLSQLSLTEAQTKLAATENIIDGQLYVVKGYVVEIINAAEGDVVIVDANKNFISVRINALGSSIGLKDTRTESSYVLKYASAKSFINANTGVALASVGDEVILLTSFSYQKYNNAEVIKVNTGVLQAANYQVAVNTKVEGAASNDTVSALTIKDAKATYTFGSELTVTAKAADGYVVASVKVMRAFGSSETLTADQNNEYKFVVLAGDTVVLSVESEKVHNATVYKNIVFGPFVEADTKIGGYSVAGTYVRDGLTVSTYAFNNNNKGWSSIKCGHKSTAYVATISTDAIDKELVKVVINFGAVSKLDKINSAKLIVATDDKFTENVQEIPFTIASGDVTVIIPNSAKNLYVKIAIDCQATSANGCIEVKGFKLFCAKED